MLSKKPSISLLGELVVAGFAGLVNLKDGNGFLDLKVKRKKELKTLSNYF